MQNLVQITMSKIRGIVSPAILTPILLIFALFWLDQELERQKLPGFIELFALEVSQL